MCKLLKLCLFVENISKSGIEPLDMEYLIQTKKKRHESFMSYFKADNLSDANILPKRF